MIIYFKLLMISINYIFLILNNIFNLILISFILFTLKGKMVIIQFTLLKIIIY